MKSESLLTKHPLVNRWNFLIVSTMWQIIFSKVGQYNINFPHCGHYNENVPLHGNHGGSKTMCKMSGK